MSYQEFEQLLGGNTEVLILQKNKAKEATHKAEKEHREHLETIMIISLNKNLIIERQEQKAEDRIIKK